jgi:hypothetical protein
MWMGISIRLWLQYLHMTFLINDFQPLPAMADSKFHPGYGESSRVKDRDSADQVISRFGRGTALKTFIRLLLIDTSASLMR